MCGSENEEHARFCMFCGEAFRKEDKKEDIKNSVDLNKDVQNMPLNNDVPSNICINPNGISETAYKQNIKTYMTHSIVSLVISIVFVYCLQIFAFIPIGLAIVAVVYAYKTEQSIKAGMIELSEKNSKMAKNFFIGSLVAFLLVFIFNIVAAIYFVFSAISSIGGTIDNFKEFGNPDQFKDYLEKILEEIQQKSGNQI
jgi:hypothetical protein